MIERSFLPSLSTYDKNSAKCGRYLPGYLAEDDVWKVRFLKKLLMRRRYFRESVEPRREKVLKKENGLNSWTRLIDRSIRCAVDTKLPHVSIEHIHIRAVITQCGWQAAAIGNYAATNAYENASNPTADRIAGGQLTEPPRITRWDVNERVCDPISRLQDVANGNRSRGRFWDWNSLTQIFVNKNNCHVIPANMRLPCDCRSSILRHVSRYSPLSSGMALI